MTTLGSGATSLGYRDDHSSLAPAPVESAAQQLTAALGFNVDAARLALLWVCSMDSLAVSAILADARPALWSAPFAMADEESLHTWLTARVDADRGTCPPAVLEAARERAAKRRLWNRYLGLAALAVCDKLQAGGVDACILKGAPLSVVAYGDAAARDIRDIDILVPEASLGAAAKLLTDDGYQCPVALRWLGYRPLLRSAREISLHKLGGAFEIDLHWGLSNRWIDTVIDDDGLRSRRSLRVQVFGREIRWFASDDLPEIARTNILNSHRVELRAFVDWLRVSRAEAMAYPHAGDIGTAVLYEPTALAMRMKRETLRLMRVAERVSGLPQEMASRDLLHAESAAAPLGRVQSWRRSFLRTRGLRRKAKLVATAFRPTVTDYENSTTVSNARTNAALRKSSLGSRK